MCHKFNKEELNEKVKPRHSIEHLRAQFLGGWKPFYEYVVPRFLTEHPSKGPYMTVPRVY
jgi:hypothetical protein